MNESRHTPGPWFIERSRSKTHPYNVMGDGFDLAHCVESADAHLISRAPEMARELEAIEAMYPNWRGKFDSLAAAIEYHTRSQDAVIKALRRHLEAANRDIEDLEYARRELEAEYHPPCGLQHP